VKWEERFQVSGFRFQNWKKTVSVFGKNKRRTRASSSLLSGAETRNLKPETLFRGAARPASREFV